MAGAGHVELPAAEMANLEEIAKVWHSPAHAAAAQNIKSSLQERAAHGTMTTEQHNQQGRLQWMSVRSTCVLHIAVFCGQACLHTGRAVGAAACAAGAGSRATHAAGASGAAADDAQLPAQAAGHLQGEAALSCKQQHRLPASSGAGVLQGGSSSSGQQGGSR